MQHTVPEAAPPVPVPVVVAAWVVDPDPDDAAIVPVRSRSIIQEDTKLTG
jgi:hypothetical protein